MRLGTHGCEYAFRVGVECPWLREAAKQGGAADRRSEATDILPNATLPSHPMSNESMGLPTKVLTYLQGLSAEGEHPALADLRAATAPMEDAQMQISVEQGRFMHWLVGTLDAKRCIEVGTFTGYSALAVALALPADGSVLACDLSSEWTDVGRPFWESAGVASKIELKIGPAAETLRSLLLDGQAASFDFAFVDADKEGYPEYAELCLELLRTGGVMAFDNAFLGGRVVEPEDDDEGAVVMHTMNAALFADSRVSVSLAPISDGLLLARKL
jgi:predicted O-methyltransferase YrrM